VRARRRCRCASQLTARTANYLLANPEWKDDTIPEIMDGKNIADFVDADIAEKLEALEREEERLAAEGFYASDDEADWFDSDDEREAAAAKVAAGAKVLSQASKKNMKNQARLPRTAGLRTLSELSGALTQAGLDPSRIEARAEILAKARAVQGKRKRAADGSDDEMDVDGEDAPALMDVDGDAPVKRAKANSGAALARAPRTNRQLAGLKDGAVRALSGGCAGCAADGASSKRTRRRGCATSASATGTGRRRRARATARSRQKWCVPRPLWCA
jgi:nucleolar GTP-binding protein